MVRKSISSNMALGVGILCSFLVCYGDGNVSPVLANPYMTVIPQRPKPPTPRPRTLPQPPQPSQLSQPKPVSSPSAKTKVSGNTSALSTNKTSPTADYPIPIVTHPNFKVVDLLNRRLYVEVPQDAERNARQISKDAAPESEERETRFFIYKRANKEELILMAAEMFATMSPDFRTRAIAYWKKLYEVPFDIKTVPIQGNYQLHLLVPLAFKKYSTLVRAAYLVRADQTVQFVAMYGSPPTIQNPAEAIALSEKILRTLKPGPRTLHIQKGERILDTADPRKKLVVQVPQNYHLVAQKAKDYHLYYINPLMALGSRGPSILVYVGNKPEPFYKREQEAKQKLTMTHPPVQLLGQSLTWSRWTKEPPKGLPQYTVKEIVIPLQELAGKPQVHILFSFTQEHAYLEDELTRVVTTLRVQNAAP